jgi:primosomal protein N' (replication factor Y)
MTSRGPLLVGIPAPARRPEAAPYAEIAVLAPLPGPLTYLIPEELRGKVQRGARVIVPLGARRLTGYVLALHAEAPKIDQIKAIEELVDESPLLEPAFLDFLVWSAEYYLAPVGEFFRAALPAQLHQASRPGFALTDAGRAFIQEARDRYTRSGEALSAEALVLASLERAGVLPHDEAEQNESLLNSCANKGLVQKVPFLEAARDRPATEKIVTRAASEPKRPLGARQRAVLAALREGPRPLRELANEVPGAREAVRGLEQAGLVAVSERELSRDPFMMPPREAPVPELTPSQAHARGTIVQCIQRGDFGAFLLHGITGSGKTEVYLQVIAENERLGRGSIVLVPEISLTPQLAGIFRGRFGEKVAVLHSGLSDAERFEQWRKIRDGRRSIVVGARSAIFAPLRELGAVVVDEEHDPSFKQEERIRYHARDLALVRAKGAGAVCVLGSATPSLESHASTKLTRLSLPDRPTPQPLPHVEVIDLRPFRGALGDAMLSPVLLGAIADDLQSGGQTILFLNRRGFASAVTCQACGFTFTCKDCDVSLTHHRAKDRLLCHYCSYSVPIPQKCPVCHERELAFLGVGTERVEARIKQEFPSARVLRLDRDISSPKEMESMLSRFSRGEADILIGTQMVSKGHDFSGVSLVGVVLADMALQLPDFRAAERTFQLLVQVAGRAGRGQRAGRVLLQSFVPEHDSIQCAKDHDYFRFAALELERRRARLFPPYAHLAALRLDGPELGPVHAAAELLRRRAVSLAPRGVEVLGPAPAPLSRLKGRVRFQLLAKGTSRPALRGFLRELLQARALIQPPIVLSVDIDPVSML